MILKTSKKYKTIKHIILSWADRELLRFPYPIIVYSVNPVFDPAYAAEVGHKYRGEFCSIYFTPQRDYPMNLKTMFSQLYFDLAREEAKLTWQEDIDTPTFVLGEPVKDYTSYFSSVVLALGVSHYSYFYYKIYSEMFDQSQRIIKDMDLDKQDLFEGVEDIKIDVSESPYKEAFLENQRFKLRLATACYGSETLDSYYAVERYYQAQNYRYGLEESKSLLLTHLGEQNSEGYSGVNENFFKNYKLRLQLAALFEIHSDYVFYFTSYGDKQAVLNKVNLWKTEPLSAEVTIKDIGNAEHFYLRRFYRKFRLFVK